MGPYAIVLAKAQRRKEKKGISEPGKPVIRPKRRDV
jgi:hypothetical protein